MVVTTISLDTIGTTTLPARAIAFNPYIVKHRIEHSNIDFMIIFPSSRLVAYPPTNVFPAISSLFLASSSCDSCGIVCADNLLRNKPSHRIIMLVHPLSRFIMKRIDPNAMIYLRKERVDHPAIILLDIECQIFSANVVQTMQRAENVGVVVPRG